MFSFVHITNYKVKEDDFGLYIVHVILFNASLLVIYPSLFIISPGSLFFPWTLEKHSGLCSASGLVYVHGHQALTIDLLSYIERILSTYGKVLSQIMSFCLQFKIPRVIYVCPKTCITSKEIAFLMNIMILYL